MSKANGTLTVELTGARNLKSTELVGKQDPYVILKIGGEKHKSRTHKNGGTNPVWNQAFIFNLRDATSNDELKIEVWDKEMFKDDGIAKVKLKLHELANSFGKGLVWHELKAMGMFGGSSGDIGLKCTWQGTGLAAISKPQFAVVGAGGVSTDAKIEQAPQPAPQPATPAYGGGQPAVGQVVGGVPVKGHTVGGMGYNQQVQQGYGQQVSYGQPAPPPPYGGYPQQGVPVQGIPVQGVPVQGGYPHQGIPVQGGYPVQQGLPIAQPVVQPVVKAHYIISNSGSPICNGRYEEYGVSDGVASYRKPGSYLMLHRYASMDGNSNRVWWIADWGPGGQPGDGDDTDYYFCNSNSNVPPTTGWRTQRSCAGKNPCPVVTYNPGSGQGRQLGTTGWH